MPKEQRFKTDYPGVYYVMGTHVATGKPEKIYYIRYRRNGQPVEEKAGRQFQDDMTPARAANKRAKRIDGDDPSNEGKRQAERAAKEAEQERMTVDRLWKKYRSNRKENKAAKVDALRYEKYIKPAFGDKEPKEIILLDADRLRRKLLKEKSPQTVKHVLNLLDWIINYGVKRGLCQGLPFHIEKPRVDNLKTEDLTPEQLQTLLKAIEEDEDIQMGNIMKMALYTGMRRGEIFNIEWRDVDFERGFITIRDPKGGQDAKIPLNDAARQVLKSQTRTKNPFVFPGRDGRRTVMNHRFIARIRKATGLGKDFRPMHGLRHVYASMLASSGQVDMYVLQRLLTHKGPQMTQRYAHLRDETLKHASNLAGNLINQAASQAKEQKVVKLAKEENEK